MRLFELFRGTHWTLLLLSVKQANAATYRTLTEVADQIGDRYPPIKTYIVTDAVPDGNWQGSVLIDRQHYLHDRYGASAACLYLICPDWFVGFRGSLNHVEQLQAYLQRALIA